MAFNKLNKQNENFYKPKKGQKFKRIQAYTYLTISNIIIRGMKLI